MIALIMHVYAAFFADGRRDDCHENHVVLTGTKPTSGTMISAFVANGANGYYSRRLSNKKRRRKTSQDKHLHEKWWRRGGWKESSMPALYSNASNNKKRSSWEHAESIVGNPYYVSPLIKKNKKLQRRLIKTLSLGHTNGSDKCSDNGVDDEEQTQMRHTNHIYDRHMTPQGKRKVMIIDPLWEQIRIEAQHTIEKEPGSGPQLYTHILSQPSLIHAVTSIVSHEISTHLIPAVSLQNLFLEMLDANDHDIATGIEPSINQTYGIVDDDFRAISLDIIASAKRSPSIIDDGAALTAVLFNQGLHALVCHRLAHRLWRASPAPRTGLAYYIQSVVSRTYSTDIHPAARFGAGIYLNAGSAGVVIGETAVVSDDVVILQGVTLGGTGKERGDRHPKVAKGVILQQSSSVLGNIDIGEGAIVGAKSIVTKPILPFHRVSGVPARDKGEVKRHSEENEGENWNESLMSLPEGEEIDVHDDLLEEMEVILRKHFDSML